MSWGTGERHAHQIMAWEYLTRRDEHEGRSDDDGHHGMIAQVEVIQEGEALDGGLDIDMHASPEEAGAVAVGLRLLKEQGRIGAENRRGLGVVSIEISGDVPEESPYLEHLSKNGQMIVEYLESIDAIVPTQNEEKNAPSTTPV